MNLNFLIKKKHVFKRRSIKSVKFSNYSSYLQKGLFTLIQTRFEFVHLRVIKKLFRKKYYKRDKFVNRVKFWVIIRPNFLLTMKSKNSRMGSGIGSYVRVCFRLKPNKPIVFFRNYSYKFILNIIKYFKLKLNKLIYML